MMASDSRDVRHYPAQRTKTMGATLVLAPGAGAGQTHPFMVAIASALAANGVDVFTFDFPYIAARRKRPDPPAVLEAAWEAAIDSVSRRIEERHRLLIGGKSMGGRIATHVAAQRQRITPGISGVVCLGYPLKPPGRAMARTLDHFSTIDVPVLILQGTRDAFGGPDDVGRAIGARHPNIEIVPIVDADHGFTVPKRAGRSTSDVIDGMAETIASWIAGAPRA